MVRHGAAGTKLKTGKASDPVSVSGFAVHVPAHRGLVLWLDIEGGGNNKPCF